MRDTGLHLQGESSVPLVDEILLCGAYSLVIINMKPKHPLTYVKLWVSSPYLLSLSDGTILQKKKSINCISKLVWHTGVGEKKMEEFLHHLWRTPISYWSKVKAMGFLTLFAFLGCCSCMGTWRGLGQSHAFVSTGKHQEEGEWLAAQSWG